MNAKEAYEYASRSKASFYYAENVLKEPFPEWFGKLIAKSAGYSCQYARNVLEAPFPLGEVAIARSAYYSYHYAIDVLDAHFPLGEAAIAKDAKYSKDYRRLFPNPAFFKY